MSFTRRSIVGLAAGACLFVAGTSGARAQDDNIDLPQQIVWTSYGVGSGAYNQGVAIGSALKNELGVNLRILPGKNDISRILPMKRGTASFSLAGIGDTYMAQEGVFEFGTRAWGPQKLRVVLASRGTSGISLATAGDAGIETLSDVAGKRVAWIAGSPTNNENIAALLGVVGLTWDDVEKVEFGGYGDAVNGIINNQADVIYAPSHSGMMFQLEASPRSLHWVPIPHDDAEGWARLKEVAPYFVPTMATSGAAVSEDNPLEAATYPLPIMTTYAEQDEALVHEMTEAMVTLFPDYDGAAPGIDGWALDRQTFDWAVPYHAGAVRYLKEAGVWTDAFESHNNSLIERQEVLAKAWEAYVASAPEEEEEAFLEGWMSARAAALTAAGMPPVYGN